MGYMFHVMIYGVVQGRFFAGTLEHMKACADF